MATTFHQLYIQTVFPVKYRNALIHPDWRPELFAVMGNLINETGCKTLIVNGVEDHVHCFFGLIPSLSISQVMKSVKAKSTKWINGHKLSSIRFEWQPGFGCFSYSRSHIDNVYHYIRRQEIHHQKKPFQKEYITMLKKSGQKFNNNFLFHELL